MSSGAASPGKCASDRDVRFSPRPGPEVKKRFSCSTHLSMIFFLLINVEMLTICEQEK